MKKNKITLLSFIVLIISTTSCSNFALGDKMFVRKIDKMYLFSKMKDSTLTQFKNKYGSDFVYKELDSNMKRLYVSHMIFQNRDLYFPKPPLYFEFKNDIMIEFGVIKPGFSSLIFKRFENGVKFVKKEEVFPISKKK
jgi:hypothetical protein